MTERRGCDHLASLTKAEARVESWRLGGTARAFHCRGCGMWHVGRKSRPTATGNSA